MTVLRSLMPWKTSVTFATQGGSFQDAGLQDHSCVRIEALDAFIMKKNFTDSSSFRQYDIAGERAEAILRTISI